MIRSELIHILPYGDEFLFVDEADHHGARHLSTKFTWRTDNPMLRAHFACGPQVVPAVLLAEQSLQTALLLAILEKHVERGAPMLIGHFRCEALRAVLVPSTTTASVSIEAIVGHNVAFRAECFSGSHLVGRIRGIAAPLPQDMHSP